ncbi:MAG: DNA polymerase I [Candidatus Moranbacteria bacterium]|nr:DNA polymerase I [Candidatus Moranbacteria bacterium]
MKKILIIDANALVHRSFHALPDSLKTKDGTLTNAVYGFMLVFLNVLERFKPDYIVAAFDRKEKTFRHKMYQDYKAKRVKAPKELYQQIPIVQKILEAFQVPVLSKKRVEADDIIGALVKKFNKSDREKLEAIIVTGDLDALQLVDDRVKVFTLKRGPRDTIIYDKEKVKQRYGLEPEQIVDYKALAGDASDNIPGVAGVGPKTATELLQKYKTLENIYKHLDQLKPQISKKLAKDKQAAMLSQKLARIKTDFDTEVELKKLNYQEPDKEKIRRILEKYEFYSLIKRLNIKRDLTKKNDEAEKNQAKIEERELKNLEQIIKKIEQISKDGTLFFLFWEKPFEKVCEKNIFNCSLDYFLFHVQGESRVYFYKFKQDQVESELNLIIKALDRFEKINLITYDQKNQISLAKLKQVKWGKIEDVEDLKLLDYLLNAGKENNTLSRQLKPKASSSAYQELIKQQKGQTKLLFEDNQKRKEQTVKNFLGHWLTCLKKNSGRLNKELEQVSLTQKQSGITPEVKRRHSFDLKKLYQEVEKPLIKILAQMELNGIKLNPDKLKQLEREYEVEAERLKQTVFDLSAEEFNLDSSQQLSKVLFEKLKLSTNKVKKGKSGFYSTSQEALETLSQKYAIAGYIIKYRELTKLINTYIQPLPELINSRTKRLHTQFHQDVTSTGRLSSSRPNLQNIPIRTRQGQKIRQAFQAEKNHCLVSLDYSQIELRIAAHYSQDQTMLEVFRRHGDIHRETAARINGIKLEQVTKEQRRAAKELNFGIIYGMGAYGLARSAKISRAQARDFIENYKNEFPQMFAYLERAKQTAAAKGYVETMLGRRRYINQIKARNWQVKANAERMAINMPLQGTAADIMKLAMLKTNQIILQNHWGEKIAMLLSVHDEILFEIAGISSNNKGVTLNKQMTEAITQIKNQMENVMELEIPLEVEAKIGKDWFEMQKFL